MDVVTDIRDFPAAYRGAACALGNFDGVHRGHRVVIDRAVAQARARGCPAAVIAFEPHPRQYFRPEDAPFRLTSLETKSRLLSELDLDILFVLTFDAVLATLSADQFANQILADALGIKHLTIGYDFRFGKDRAGDAGFLARWGAAHDVSVDVVEPVRLNTGHHDIYSSSLVRQLLRAGDVVQAASVLGRAWCIDGLVQHGDKRGRTIGFPTLNVDLGDYLRPALGVYVIEARVEEGVHAGTYQGLANVGRRPTFDQDDVLLEAHLFDFDGDLYGVRVFVSFLDFIRREQKFDGLEALKAQIARDCDAARHIHDRRTTVNP